MSDSILLVKGPRHGDRIEHTAEAVERLDSEGHYLPLTGTAWARDWKGISLVYIWNQAIDAAFSQTIMEDLEGGEELEAAVESAYTNQVDGGAVDIDRA